MVGNESHGKGKWVFQRFNLALRSWSFICSFCLKDEVSPIVGLALFWGLFVSLLWLVSRIFFADLYAVKKDNRSPEEWYLRWETFLLISELGGRSPSQARVFLEGQRGWAAQRCGNLLFCFCPLSMLDTAEAKRLSCLVALDCHTGQSPEPAQPTVPFQGAVTCWLIPGFPCEPGVKKRIYEVGKGACLRKGVSSVICWVQYEYKRALQQSYSENCKVKTSPVWF